MILETTRPQEVFNYVAKHLFTQGKQARVKNTLYPDNTKCAYRNEDGLKCAVGCLLDDEYYQPEMDQEKSSGIRNIVSKYQFPQWVTDNLGLVSQLQSVHDNSNNWLKTRDMHVGLSGVARFFNLSMDFVNTLKFEDR